MANEVRFIQSTSDKLATIPKKVGQIIFLTDTRQIFQDSVPEDGQDITRCEYYPLATTNNNEVMSSSDKVKLDNIKFVGNAPELIIGMGTSTKSIRMYSGNVAEGDVKIGIVGVNLDDDPEGVMYSLTARTDYLRLYNNTTKQIIYEIYPFSQSEKTALNQNCRLWQSGVFYQLNGYYSGGILPNRTSVVFTLYHTRISDPDGNNRVPFDYLYNNPTKLTDTTYFKPPGSSISLMMMSNGTFLTPGVAAGSGGNVDISNVYLHTIGHSHFSTTFSLTHRDSNGNILPWTKSDGVTPADTMHAVSIKIGGLTALLWPSA